MSDITEQTKIKLPHGWVLEFVPRDNDSLQAFIIRGNRSASLEFALETGTDSTEDKDIEQAALIEARNYEEYT